MSFSVLGAFRDSWSFIASRWLDLLKVLWFPMAAMSLGDALLTPRYVMFLRRILEEGPEGDATVVMGAMGSLIPVVLALMALALVTSAMAFGGVARLALNDTRPSLPINLTFGVDELRLIGTNLVTALILAAAMFGWGVVRGAVGMAAGGAAVAMAMDVAAYLTAAFLLVRLSLATPAVIDERAIGVGPSWRATRGRFLALFGYWSMIGLVLLMAVFGLEAILPLPEGVTLSAPSADPIQQQLDMLKVTEALSDLSNPVNLARQVVFFVVTMAAAAIVATASCMAWRQIASVAKR